MTAKSKKRNWSARLHAALKQGKTVVCSFQPFFDMPVEFKPRSRFDPMPWVVAGVGEDWRYSGRDCHIRESE